MLYLVSTPIGNMEDITLRAINTLKEVDLIAAEDTRRTGILLKKLDIKNKMISFNDHNKERRLPHLIEHLKHNTLAVVSDCGTPSINDPGFNIVREAIKHNIAVIPIPGPSSILAALVASGLPTDSFTFYGFVPKKTKARIDFLKNIKTETAICFESPHRIIKTVTALQNTLPDAKICIARELTKKFEELIRGTPEEIQNLIQKKPLKGEIVLLISTK